MRSLLPVLIIFCLSYGSIPNEKLYEVESEGYFTGLTKSAHGIIASNNLDNALYLINEGGLKILLENPGCGRYISVHKNLIGFKFIDTNTGLQSPAFLDITS
ncbi:MAG: hypothetical protein WCS93_03850, partial [Candidatus Delongbacteria bacterium]